MSSYAVLGMMVGAAASAWTESVLVPDLQGPPAAGLIQWGDRLRRQFENSPAEEEEDEQQQQDEPNQSNSENLHADAPVAMVQYAKLKLHGNGDANKLPSAETHIFAKDEMDHARSPHRNPSGHAHTELAREVQIMQNGRLPSQHMTLAQRQKQDSNAINSLLEAARGKGSQSAVLLQEGHEKGNPPLQVAQMPEEMVGQDEDLVLPEDGTANLRGLHADQGVAMLQHADQIIQTGELIEEDVPLSQFREQEPCSEGSCRPEARQWWELLGNY